jgi:hypothetical protein
LSEFGALVEELGPCRGELSQARVASSPWRA